MNIYMCIYMYIYVYIYGYSIIKSFLQCFTIVAIGSTRGKKPKLLFEAMDMDTFRKTLDDSMFSTSSSFQKEIMYKDLDCQEFEDSAALRAMCVFMHCELVDAPIKCSVCKASCTLVQGRSANELLWLCNNN